MGQPSFTVQASNGAWYQTIVGFPPDTCVARAIGSTREECDANSRLVSAAPELLEACRMILASAPDTRKGFPHWNYEEAGERDYALALKAAYAAIRKATGTDGAGNTYSEKGNR